MKDKIATAVTILVIGAILAYVLIARPGGGSGGDADDPGTAVGRMIDTAKSGDVDGYLDCFSGSFRKRMAQARDDMGAERFRAHLRETGTEIKGFAVSDEDRRRNKARMRVEFVHAEYNEEQWVSVRKEGGTWRIYAMTEAQRKIPPVKYGTPVIPLLPSEEAGQEPTATNEGGYGEPEEASP